MYSNKNKWLMSLCITLLFLLLASPCMYTITGKTTLLVNWETSHNGCPNWMGLLLHTIVFLLFVRLSFAIAKSKETFGNPNFIGLVNPANMSIVNDLRIEAQDKGCKVDEVINQVQLDPYNKKKAKDAAAYCRKNCTGLSERRLQVLENIPNWQNPSYSIWDY